VDDDTAGAIPLLGGVLLALCTSPHSEHVLTSRLPVGRPLVYLRA
jgi:hypothetical protein